MTRSRIALALSVALLGSAALTACKKDAPAPAPPVATAPVPAPVPPVAPQPTPAVPSVSVTAVELGNAIGEDKRVLAPSTTFAKTDTIHAAVATTASDLAMPSTGRLTARWTYQDGQQVSETSQDYRFTGSGMTVFQISKPDGWPTGRYKVEILLDGTLVQTREFEVK